MNLLEKGKLDFNDKYELMLYFHKNKEDRAKRRLERKHCWSPDSAEDKELVFKPTISQYG